MFFSFFFVFKKMKRELPPPPPPIRRASRLKAWVRFRPRIVFLFLFRRGSDGVYLFSTHMQATYDEFLFFFVFQNQGLKRNNEQLIDASLFLFFVDPLLD